MKKQILITDLDNTLHDWVSHFASALRKTFSLLTELGFERGELLRKFKSLHQRHGTTEVPGLVRPTFKLYPGVAETCASLRRKGVTIIGYTAAPDAPACQRIRQLGLDAFFQRVYTAEKKPNASRLRAIVRTSGFEPGQAVCIGDSLTEDVAPALEAGITAVWARYGTLVSGEDWALLARVTHQTDAEATATACMASRSDVVAFNSCIDDFSAIRCLFA